MRLSLALAGLVIATGPAWAEDPPPSNIKNAIGVYWQALAAGTYCVGYRVNHALLSDFLSQSGLDGNTVSTLYPSFSQNVGEITDAAFNRDPKTYCDIAVDLMGDVGKYPHLIVRR